MISINKFPIATDKGSSTLGNRAIMAPITAIKTPFFVFFLTTSTGKSIVNIIHPV